MAARDELSSPVLFGHLGPCDEETNGTFSSFVPLVIPLIYFLVEVVADIVVSVQRLSLAARSDPHCSTRVDVRLRYRLLPLVAPPEPVPCGKEMLAHLLINRVHHLGSSVRRAKSQKS